VGRFRRNDIRAMIAAAGYSVVAEDTRPATREAMIYWANGRLAKAKATSAAWARHAIFAVAGPRADWVYSLVYYAVCTRRSQTTH
jgi:hypothetical protein